MTSLGLNNCWQLVYVVASVGLSDCRGSGEGFRGVSQRSLLTRLHFQSPHLRFGSSST